MRKFRPIHATITLIAILFGAAAIDTHRVAIGQNINEAQESFQMAAQLAAKKKYIEAESLYKRALAITEKQLGLDHQNVASVLNNLANLYEKQGLVKRAEPLYKRALTILTKALGPDHPYVAVTQRNLAGIYQHERRYDEAEPLLKSVVEITEKTKGQDHIDVAAILNILAVMYREQARYSEAEPLFKRVVDITERAQGPDHPDVAQAINGLAATYLDLGRYKDAEIFYQRARTVVEAGLRHDDPNVGLVLTNLAEVYRHQARYSEAEPLSKRALKIAETAFGSNHAEVADKLNNLALLYEDEGRYADAEPLYRRALAIDEKQLGSDHSDLLSSLNNLAGLYQKQDRYAEAEQLYKRALPIAEKELGLDHPKVGMVLSNLADIYGEQERYVDAESLYKRVLAIDQRLLGPDAESTAHVLRSLARLFRMQSRYSEAEPLAKRALEIEEKALGPEHPNVALTLEVLAQVSHAQGQFDKAEASYIRAQRIYEKSLGMHHPRVAILLNNLAVVYNDQGAYAKAEKIYKLSLAIQEETFGPDNLGVAATLGNIAGVYLNQDRYAEAVPIVFRLIDKRRVPKSLAFPVLFNAQEKGQLNVKKPLEESYNILQFSTASAAGLAVNRLAQRYAARTDELAGLVRNEQDLIAEGDRLDKALIAAASKGPNERIHATEEQMRRRLAEIEIERNKLAETLTKRFPDYAALSNPPPLTLAETRDLLADDEAVIAFDIGERRSYAWVVKKSDAFWTELPITSDVISEQVQQLRQSLTFNRDKAFDAVLAYNIYQETFLPIASKIEGVKRLSIIANGALTSIPFALLVTSNPAGKSLKETDWLVKSYAVTILPSIYSLKTMRAQKAIWSAPKPMIAFADPVFSRQAYTKLREQQVAMRSLPSIYQGSHLDVRSLGEQLVQLPGTRSEVETISKSLRAESDIKIGLKATESAVKHGKLDQYRIIYFATHSLVAGDLEKFSKAKAEPALVLTIPDKPTDQDDGLLMASEVAQLKLNADWAVLSACNTASGDGVGAEALSGLARAFLYAGARSLVVSHWDVSDVATTALMSNLFAISASKPNISHGEALREATLNLIDASKTDDDAHPRVWAPFVVVGEPAKE